MNLIELIHLHIDEEEQSTFYISKDSSCIVNKFIKHKNGYGKEWAGKILAFNKNRNMYEVHLIITILIIHDIFDIFSHSKILKFLTF